MMNTRKFSLYLAGVVWILVSIRIGSRAIGWLEVYINPLQWQLVFVLISGLVGWLKCKTVLKKSVKRSLANIDKVDESPINYAIGWLKLFGTKGIIMISLMIALGYGLRFLRAGGGDPYQLFGFIYLAVAIGLAAASLYYFRAAKEGKLS